ncbi:MAG: ATP-binding protein [Lactobacillus sp.]|jgi:energy-coupling factor transporter ATP-binding protein EcfA2|nr:ATP-binding protein [Lactobacillus sp.]MCI2032358.1 ATP-binding protein [Lactobacillus sp.]
MLKLIEFRLSGHTLFEDGTFFSIQASGKNSRANSARVIDFGHALFLEKTIGVVGVNAAGKSTLFNLFDGLSAFYLKDLSIDQTTLQEGLRGEGDVVVDAYIADQQGLRYWVNTTFTHDAEGGGHGGWHVKDEVIYRKQLPKSARKKDQFIFTAEQLLQRRASLAAEVKAMLSPKDSSFRAFRGQSRVSEVLSTVQNVDTNRVMTFVDQTPIKLLRYLDNSIERLDYESDHKTGRITNVRLKFKGRPEILTATDFEGITKYLSSGTVRGITLFFEMIVALRSGATLLVDEIELHINKQIAEDFVNFFQDPTINTANATLVFSTHYLELLDRLERKDEIYFLARQAQSKVYRYDEIADIRGELKKSDVFKSNFIPGTAPNFDHLKDLRHDLEQIHSRRKEHVETTEGDR